jgi:hypothetical protein
MTVPGGPAAEQPGGLGSSGVALACDLHLARSSPLCDALGALDWRWPWLWFHDFGLATLDRGPLLRLGVTPPSGAMGHIKALIATLIVPGIGVIGTQEFPLAPYANGDRSAATAIILCEQEGRFGFVRGAALLPLSAAERRCLARACRAIETWAALLSGGGLPAAASDPAAHAAAAGMRLDDQPASGDLPASGDHPTSGDHPASGDQDQLVVLDEVEPPARAP